MSRWRLWARRPLVRRLASPTGLILACLCFLLPFLTAACSGELPQGVPEDQRQQWRVTYTGVDIFVGGQPDVAWADADSEGRLRALDEADLVGLIGPLPSPLAPQPLAWLAVALIGAALAATALKAARWRAAVTAGLALAAALALFAATLLAREQTVDIVAGVLRRFFATSLDSPQTPINEWEYWPWVRGQFQLEYGLWMAMGLLFALGMANVAQAVPDRWGVRRSGRRRDQVTAPAP